MTEETEARSKIKPIESTIEAIEEKEEAEEVEDHLESTMIYPQEKIEEEESPDSSRDTMIEIDKISEEAAIEMMADNTEEEAVQDIDKTQSETIKTCQEEAEEADSSSTIDHREVAEA